MLRLWEYEIYHFLKKSFPFFFNVAKGGSERKREVAGAGEKHNSSGEVLTKGQNAPISLAGCGNLRDGEAGASLCTHPSHSAAPGGGSSKAGLRCCWMRVRAAFAPFRAEEEGAKLRANKSLLEENPAFFPLLESRVFCY